MRQELMLHLLDLKARLEQHCNEKMILKLYITFESEYLKLNMCLNMSQ